MHPTWFITECSQLRPILTAYKHRAEEAEEFNKAKPSAEKMKLVLQEIVLVTRQTSRRTAAGAGGDDA